MSPTVTIWTRTVFLGLLIPTSNMTGASPAVSFATTILSSKINRYLVAIYLLGVIALCYHLLHGFQSAFQTLGLNHKKYTPMIKSVGFWFSIIITLLFASMPITMHLGLIK
jgi:succinate dehydrogenase / fumarate reductase cytochrome b subunit